jgi:hypothetical protein
MSPEDTIAAVKSAGLNLLTVVELPPYHYRASLSVRPHRETFRHERQVEPSALPERAACIGGHGTEP